MPIGQRRPSLPLVSVVMPVYNEGDTVGIVIDDLLSREFDEFDMELIIIESNSLDSSRQVVERYAHLPGVTVILQEIALGKGHAVRRGFQEITGDIVLIQDADLEYTIDDYPIVINPILTNQAKLVLGNRGHHGGAIREMPGEVWSSRITNFGHVIFTFIFNMVFRQRLEDPFTMYKVFRVECIEGMNFTANRFDFDWELLGKLCRRGYKPLEVPINYQARGFESGKKIRLVRDPLTWIRAALRYRFSKLDEKDS